MGDAFKRYEYVYSTSCSTAHLSVLQQCFLVLVVATYYVAAALRRYQLYDTGRLSLQYTEQRTRLLTHDISSRIALLIYS